MTSSLKKSRAPRVSLCDDVVPVETESSGDQIDKLICYIDDNVIGKGSSFCGPFGRRKVVYCDYNGSGRALQFIEEHIARNVLPTHATQCTAMSHTSLQTNLYRSEARQLMLKSVGGDPENDVVILGGSLQRLLRLLMLHQRVVVFVSSRETERNVNVWRNCGAEVKKIWESKEGYIDLNTLEACLQEYTGSGRKMVGYFPAVSKLTGVLADDVATTLLLHQYGALAFWDYTLVAPTAGVDMNPTFPGVEEEMVRKDAVFFNCEKFVGGVQGPYVTVLKKHLLSGCVFYTDDVQKLTEYYEDCSAVEAVRSALVVQLRDTVGVTQVAEKQDQITRQVLAHIRTIPELILLGCDSPTARRLPIFSLLVKHPRGTFLHHNFVCAVLNDVFGIQARGGLSGNLSYGEDVLGIDRQLLHEYEKLLNYELQKEIQKFAKPNETKTVEYNEHLRPGFFRIALPFFMSENELAFVLEALKMVATEGWKILPQYVVNPKNGQWRHHTNVVFRDRKSLLSIRYTDGKMTANDRRFSGPGIFPHTYTECLQTARNLFSRARKLAMKCSIAEQDLVFNPKTEFLRWFMLPKEAHELLLGKSANVKQVVPFDPSGFTGARKSLISFQKKTNAACQLYGNFRHYSLSAIDDCHIARLKSKHKFFSRDSSVVESEKETNEIGKVKTPPVQFAVGGCVSPLKLSPQIGNVTSNLRSRCYSLGSDTLSPILSPQARANVGLADESDGKKNGFCHCGSQTDLQSLDDPMFSPPKSFYANQESNSISDCSQVGRVSPTASITSQTSEEIEAYVKEISNEIADEIKSEIRGVISQVEDVLENSDALEASNQNANPERRSVSVLDVAEYLMGMSREMASEMKLEIREMVNQVDVLMSPDSSRRNSPPNKLRERLGSGSSLGLKLDSNPAMKKSPTSPISLTELEKSSKASPAHDSGPNSISFNSSETSTPDTIIQVVTNAECNHDLACCTDLTCRQLNSKKWYQNPSVSSQDSGINLSFTDSECFGGFVKRRTQSDPTTSKQKQRFVHNHDKSEVPDIIEGVPVCAGDYQRTACSNRSKRCSIPSSRLSPSECAEHSDMASPAPFANDNSFAKADDSDSDIMRRLSESSGGGGGNDSDNSDNFFDNLVNDFTMDEDGKWRRPTKQVWKGCVESIHEFSMIKHQDKVLVCLSGGRRSLALLHTLHQYQFFARSKGIHFTLGAIYVNDNQSKIDPLQLMSYCKNLGVKFIYQDSSDSKADDKCISRASWLCGWADHSVRSSVYAGLHTHDYNVAALAHTLDYAAQAFLATAFDAGVLRTLKAHYNVKEHNIRVIRPFIYVREKYVLQFAEHQLMSDFNVRGGDGSHTDTESCSSPDDSVLITSSTATRTSSTVAIAQNLRNRKKSDPFILARNILVLHERSSPCIFGSLKSALHPLIKAKNIDRDLRDHRHRKKSVIQMRNGMPVYDSDEGTEEEPVS